MFLDDRIKTSPDLSSTLKHFLLTLCSYADHRGICYPSQETLARAMSVSVATVKRCLSDAVELQLVAVRRRWRRSNVYRLLCCKEPELSTMGSRTSQENSHQTTNERCNGSDQAPRSGKKWVPPSEIALLLDDIGEIMGPKLVEQNRGFYVRVIRSVTSTYELIQDCLHRVKCAILEAQCTGQTIHNPSGLFWWSLKQAGVRI